MHGAISRYITSFQLGTPWGGKGVRQVSQWDFFDSSCYYDVGPEWDFGKSLDLLAWFRSDGISSPIPSIFRDYLLSPYAAIFKSIVQVQVPIGIRWKINFKYIKQLEFSNHHVASWYSFYIIYTYVYIICSTYKSTKFAKCHFYFSILSVEHPFLSCSHPFWASVSLIKHR